jgi:hypothetical protein
MDRVDKSINNYFEKELIDNGYRWFKDNLKSSIRGFQKRITDEKGTKYFITGYHYNFHTQGYVDESEDRDSYSFTAQFNIITDGVEKTIDISLGSDFIHNEWRKLCTLKEAEEFFENSWNTMKCEYYELY